MTILLIGHSCAGGNPEFVSGQQYELPINLSHGGMEMKRSIQMSVFIVFLFTASFAMLPPVQGQGKPVELFYSNVFPAPHKLCVSAVEWSKEVEKRTGGKVKINMAPGGTLTPGDKCYDGVAKGLSHLGMSVFSYTIGRFPMLEIIDMPLGYKTGMAATRLANDFIAKFKPKELNDVQVMYIMGNGPGMIHTKKPVNKLQDLKGMKIRATGTTARIVEALGGSAVGMPMPDTYDALSKGVVDGVICPVEALEGWRLGEVTSFSIKTPVTNSVCMFVVMNKDSWKALPADVQQVISKVNEEWIPRTGALWDEIDKSGYEFVAKRNHKVTTPAAEEQPRWSAAVKPLLDDYVTRTKAKGLPGDEALKYCQDWLSKNQ
jgi:TRAP-type transport system periplasmic protein